MMLVKSLIVAIARVARERKPRISRPEHRRRKLRWSVIAAVLLAGMTVTATPASAETKEVRIAEQFGIAYLPLQMMREKGLIERHAKAAGLGDIKVTWARFGSGASMNDALLSGNLDFATGGVGPLITIWAKTKGSLNVRGVATLCMMPLYLTTRNPNVKSIKDFTDNDRIALPAVKVSLQARTLQMAAEQAFGPGKYDVLDRLTVSMRHPDGTAAMLSGKSEITAHFSGPPFQQQQLRDPNIRKILSSFDVLGGPTTFVSVWARSSFRDDNPKTYKAFVDAMREAMKMINADKKAAAAVFIKQTKSKLDRAFVEKIVMDPENVFTTTPRNTMKYAVFMHKVGAIAHLPESWKDYYFPEIHDEPGS
jgi:NitT/TauT family transport system substrate-binding protein